MRACEPRRMLSPRPAGRNEFNNPTSVINAVLIEKVNQASILWLNGAVESAAGVRTTISAFAAVSLV